MKASIEVRGLTKTFSLASKEGQAIGLFEALRQGGTVLPRRNVRALDGISFSISEGERVGILGRNGAGKTTLLSILANLSRPTSGTVTVSGEIHAMLTIGAVLKEELTGRENIMLDAAMHGHGPDEIAVVADDMIAFAELGDFIERPVRTYSSGMKARLAFSMGAFIDPDILILDETLAVGDVFFSEKAGRRMKEIADRGRIVVLVTQSSAAIIEMCTRCLWLDDGLLRMDGAPDEVTAAYEASMRDADEAALMRKFGAEPDVAKRPEVGRIRSVELVQENICRRASTLAMRPLTIRTEGVLVADADGGDLELSLSRVDGRKLWQQSLVEAGQAFGDQPSFKVDTRLEPFILGKGLYRLEVRLIDKAGPIDAAIRVFEVVDEEGQFGGEPLLLSPAAVKSRPLKELVS